MNALIYKTLKAILLLSLSVHALGGDAVECEDEPDWDFSIDAQYDLDPANEGILVSRIMSDYPAAAFVAVLANNLKVKTIWFSELYQSFTWYGDWTANVLSTVKWVQGPGSTIPNVCFPTPLIVDLGENKLDLSSEGVGVWFDFYDLGAPIHMQWTAPNSEDAFLIHDVNDNELVDNGGELFGDGAMDLTTGERAKDGFAALAQWDETQFGGNNDGSITSSDAVWDKLALWTDSNADGVSQSSELLWLSESNFDEFPTSSKEKKRYDDAGNRLALWGWAKQNKGKKHKLIDVFFATIE